MDPSPVALALFVTFLLGFTHTTLADQVQYCNGICPEFTCDTTDGTYMVRHYPQTAWMCTVVTDNNAVMQAAKRLTAFSEEARVSPDTWPVLFSVKGVEGNEKYELCYFIPPGSIPAGKDKVTVEIFPPATMFVRFFEGQPSLEGGEQRAKQLKKDLIDAGKSFNSSVHYGAGYESFLAWNHHNEIWFIQV